MSNPDLPSGAYEPAVSVLMTTFNGQRFIEEAIRSVQLQTFQDWELVIVDDASGDSTASLVRGIDDQRITLLELAANAGQTAALNRGLGLARGRYIARLDQDDLARPDRLEALAAELDNDQGLVLVGSWAEVVNERGEVTGELRLPTSDPEIRQALVNELWSNPLIHSSVMYRRAAVSEVGGYPTGVKLANDYALWIKLMGSGSMRNIPQALASFRVHDSQASRGPAFAVTAREVLEAGSSLDADLGLGPDERDRWRSARTEYALETLGVMLTTEFRLATIRQHFTYFAKVALSHPASLVCIPRVARRAIRNRRSGGLGATSKPTRGSHSSHG